MKSENESEEDNETRKEDEDEEEDIDDNSILTIKRIGSILRSGEGRIQNIIVDKSGRLLALHGTDNNLELFIVCTQEEIQKRLAKKAKKECK